MDREFWYQRWRAGETGFHDTDVNPLLVRYWPGLEVDRSDRVFVPLCGKSVDMVWLASRGHRVLGVELSPIAVEAFFDEQGLDPRVRHRDGLEIWDAGDIRVYCGDFFALDRALTGRIGAVYDRAALIALPETMRADYVRHLRSLLPPAGAPMLLVTLDYDAAEMDGPPFPVTHDEVDDRFGVGWRIEQVHVEDALAGSPRLRERGLTALSQAVYRLLPRAD